MLNRIRRKKMYKRFAIVTVILMVFSLFHSSFLLLNSSRVLANEDLGIENFQVVDVTDETVSLSWSAYDGAESYNIYWANKDTEHMEYKLIETVKDTTYTFTRSTHVPHYFKIAAVIDDEEQVISDSIKSSTKKEFNVQLEDLDRGLVAALTDEGVFLS